MHVGCLLLLACPPGLAQAGSGLRGKELLPGPQAVQGQGVAIPRSRDHAASPSIFRGPLMGKHAASSGWGGGGV